ncbi:MAG: HAD-IA family hydrolase [Pseudomonadota bacterium]|nr:HAD-IA family hydrolase [Pseudomonadota bacterium]
MTPYPNRSFQACLFDMDGTLLTSIESAERVWSRWLKMHSLDPELILPTIHGVQTLETIKGLCIPGIDPLREAARIAEEETADLQGVRVVEGAAIFLSGLPSDSWAIVTSATRDLAEARLKAAGLNAPALFLTAEDIIKGKPAPDCYIEAASRLGKNVTECLVFEDATAGIEAGRAAGCSVVIVTRTHSHRMESEYPQIRDFQNLTARCRDGLITIAPIF